MTAPAPEIAALQDALEDLYDLRDELRILCRPAWVGIKAAMLAIKFTHNHRVREPAQEEWMREPAPVRYDDVDVLSFKGETQEVQSLVCAGHYEGKKYIPAYREITRTICIPDQQQIKARKIHFNALVELREEFGGELEDWRQTCQLIRIFERQLNALLKPKKNSEKK